MQQEAMQRDDVRNAPRAARWAARAFAMLCFLVALAAPGSIFDLPELRWLPPGEWPGWVLQLHWIVALLVFAPFAIVAIVASDLRASRGRSLRLELKALRPSLAGIPPEHVEEDRVLWDKREDAALTLWRYEKDRIMSLRGRLGLQALLFGDLTTLALMCSALLAMSGPRTNDSTTAKLACSIAAATGAVFLANLARILLRVSGGDVTTRTFSWAIRSVILVIIADIGLYVLLDGEVSTVMSSATRAVVLGLFVGATGDHAIQFLLDKASKAFGTGAVAAHAVSPLLGIEGIADVHVDRLEEEAVVSIHDLAFVPTARLFFSTAYSLQQICNWQDRALLQVYVGKKAAEALAEQMHIRGAIDLRAFAHDMVFGCRSDQAAQVKVALGKALALDGGGLTALLESMAHDEAAMRIRYYWGAVISECDDAPRPSIEVTVRPPLQPPAPPPGGGPGPDSPHPRIANGSTPPNASGGPGPDGGLGMIDAPTANGAPTANDGPTVNGGPTANGGPTVNGALAANSGA
jgi:hypothetical protein